MFKYLTTLSHRKCQGSIPIGNTALESTGVAYHSGVPELTLVFGISVAPILVYSLGLRELFLYIVSLYWVGSCLSSDIRYSCQPFCNPRSFFKMTLTGIEKFYAVFYEIILLRN